MPIIEPEPQTIDPLLAQILTANANWSAAVSDRVLDNKDREIREWKSRFLKLYEAVESANTKVDSLRIQNELDHFAYYTQFAAGSFDFK